MSGEGRSMRKTVNVLDRLHRAGGRQVDGGSAVVFRVAIGLLGSASVWRFIANDWVRELVRGPGILLQLSRFRMGAPVA